MRLLSETLTTAATTIAGSTNPITTAARFGSPTAGAHRIEAVQFTGGSSIESTVGYLLRAGESSDNWTTYVLAPGGSSDLNVRIDGLGILANNWELVTPTTSARGTVGIVFGN